MVGMLQDYMIYYIYYMILKKQILYLNVTKNILIIRNYSIYKILQY